MQASDNNLQYLNLLNLINMQKSHNNYYTNSELNPLIGVNKSNAQPKGEFFNFNVPMSSMPRNTASGMSQIQNGPDSQQLLQSLLSQSIYNSNSEINRNHMMNNYLGSNMMNTFGNYNQFPKADGGAVFENYSLLNQYNNIIPQFNISNNDYGTNLAHELLRKRMRDNEIVNDFISPNLNNRVDEYNRTLSNQARDLPSSSGDICSQTRNVLNSQNLIYNSLQSSNNN